MAAADYRLCDVCSGKAFYDANLNYEQGRHVATEKAVRNGGMMMAGTELDRLGDWVVLCETCTKTHRCVIEPIAITTPTPADSGVPPALHENDVPALWKPHSLAFAAGWNACRKAAKPESA